MHGQFRHRQYPGYTASCLVCAAHYWLVARESCCDFCVRCPARVGPRPNRAGGRPGRACRGDRTARRTKRASITVGWHHIGCRAPFVDNARAIEVCRVQPLGADGAGCRARCHREHLLGPRNFGQWKEPVTCPFATESTNAPRTTRPSRSPLRDKGPLLQILDYAGTPPVVHRGEKPSAMPIP
jgi:hypothetical protein